MNMFTEMPPEKQVKIVGKILGNALIRLMMEEQKNCKNEVGKRAKITFPLALYQYRDNKKT